jgi:hypothetical protein
MADDDKTDQTVKRLLETTQNVFIFQALRSGVSGEVVKSLLRIDTDRITRVSKLLKKARKQEDS